MNTTQQGAGCNCDPSAVEEGWRGAREMRGRPPPRGFIKEQKGPYALLSVAGFVVGALVAAAVTAALLALRRRRPGAGAGTGFPTPDYQCARSSVLCNAGPRA